ncbi:hypothetical protein [Pseudomonas helmanticensis]|jgi:hypothetical protein|nr:hypothetical protein [Pseudomonas helmanticensis]
MNGLLAKIAQRWPTWLALRQSASIANLCPENYQTMLPVNTG